MRRSITLTVVLLALTVLGCPGSRRPPAVAAPSPGGPGSDAAGRSRTEPLDLGPDIRQVGDDAARGVDWSEAAGGGGGPLADILFGLDRADLSEEAKATLEKHALWLQNHREARVTVEGHCDDRGTAEYNLALGAQRAKAAEAFLVSLGVSAERLRTVSYGKERPLDPGSGEAAWARNRRAHFAVARQ
jgi:peptidoglycan-associated lipoprotein